MFYLHKKIKPSIWFSSICVAFTITTLLFTTQIQELKAETATAQMPDFFIEDLRLDTPDPNVGEQILFSAKLKNIGNTTIDQWSVKIEGTGKLGTSVGTYFTNIAPGEYAVYPSTTSDVDGWISQGGFIIRDYQGPGEYTFEVTLDPYNNLNELDENNNFKMLTIYVDPEGEEPSDVCTDSDGGIDFYTKGTCSYPGNSATDFCNLGYAVNKPNTEVAQCSGSDCYTIDYYCKEDNIISWERMNCPNGCVDGACAGTSTDLPDLTVSSIKTSTAPTYSDTITITSTVKNKNGNLLTTSAKTYLNDLLLSDYTIPASSSAEVSWNVVFLVDQMQDGENTIEVIVDSENSIVEENELNNNKTYFLKLDDTNKPKHAAWWGKVLKHTENNEWVTDPDGTSGANLDKYDYCKKWYPETNYAIYDGREYIDDFKNAGNVNSYSETPPTYECTEDDVVTDYEIQKKVYKNNQEIEVNLPDGPVKIKIIANTGYSAYTTCGDTMVQFYVNGAYASRYFCAEDSDTVNNVKVTLTKIIHGDGQIYLVADVEQTTETETPYTYQRKDNLIARDIIDRIKGKIILRVENRGETFYLPPDTDSVYYFNNADTTLDIIEQEGVGISNENLSKIPIGLDDFNEEVDSDSDGLYDDLEDALGTDKNNPDSDNDSYLDGEEVFHGYSPLGAGKQEVNTNLTNSVSGKILLQVESRGEAWYVNPTDNKRYYMKNGEAAYGVLSEKGQGISDNDLSQVIEIN